MVFEKEREVLKRAFEMVTDLYCWGMSCDRIAHEAHLRQSVVYRILKQQVKRPHLETEIKIRTLYEKYFGKGN